MGAIDAILDETNQHQEYGRVTSDTSRVDLDFSLDTTEEILTNAYAQRCKGSLINSKYSLIHTIHEQTSIESVSFHEIIMIRKHAQAMARFRLSCYGLRVETGRWGRKPIPRIGRYCLHCSSGQVDDESHFLFECAAHSSERLKLKIKLQKHSAKDWIRSMTRISWVHLLKRASYK